jgi:hypothetical protein
VPADTPTSAARSRSTAKPRPGFGRSAVALAQANRASGWAPILAAIAIDLADLAMVGPTGLVFGLVVGGLLTTLVARASGTRWRRALGLGVLGGVYCTLPFDAVPVATMLTLVHVALTRLNSSSGELGEATSEPDGKIIDTSARISQLETT